MEHRDDIMPAGSTVTEAELILRARRGDEDALSELVHAHAPAIRRLAWRLLGDPDEADDCVQEVSIRLHRALPTLRHDSRLAAWCYRTALNWCRDRHRAGARFAPGSHDFDSIPTRMPSPVEHAEALDRRVVLDRLVGALPPRWREVVTLRYAAGLGIAEIAEVVGCPQGTVASRLYRSLDRIGREMAARGLDREAL